MIESNYQNLNARIKDEIERLKMTSKTEDARIAELDAMMTKEQERHRALVTRMRSAEAHIEPCVNIQSTLKATKQANEAVCVELKTCKDEMSDLTGQLRHVAQELKETNRQREALLAANLTLKRQRADEEAKLNERKSVITIATEELADLERTLMIFNQNTRLLLPYLPSSTLQSASVAS